MKNHEKIMIFMIFHDFRDFFMIFHDFFMNNQKFSKSPKFFAIYLESSKNVLRLRNAFGSARPTQHRPWKKWNIFKLQNPLM